MYHSRRAPRDLETGEQPIDIETTVAAASLIQLILKENPHFRSVLSALLIFELHQAQLKHQEKQAASVAKDTIVNSREIYRFKLQILAQLGISSVVANELIDRLAAKIS